jgi:hypothetical protein
MCAAKPKRHPAIAEFSEKRVQTLTNLKCTVFPINYVKDGDWQYYLLYIMNFENLYKRGLFFQQHTVSDGRKSW